MEFPEYSLFAAVGKETIEYYEKLERFIEKAIKE